MTTQINWDQVDWLKQDIVLSRELGCSREAVRQARIRLKGGSPVSFHGWTGETIKNKLVDIDTTLYDISQLADKLGASKRHVATVLRELGLSCKSLPNGNSVHDWSKLPVDWWKKTDKELAVIIGVDSPAVVTQWRFKHGLNKKKVSYG